MTNPDSLVARLYKARYYPRCNFFESTLGHKPSFVWRSICNSKFILKAGSRWRIGDGDDISVWYNKWIANDITLIPHADGDFPLADLRVSDCMLHDRKEWNLPFLQSIFDHQVVEHIVKTPLYPSVTEDRLIWKKENHGEYSVRSAYRFCVQELLDTSHFKVQGSWNLIWKLKVPPKVKIFMWRICRNCLPTRVRLKDKGVTCPMNCTLCTVSNEDTLHLFFQCPSSLNVWSMLPFFSSISILLQQDLDSKNIIFKALQDLSKDDADLFCCVLWSIWKQRNNRVWNEVIDAPVYVVERAKVMLHDWQDARRICNTSCSHLRQEGTVKWIKPAEGRFKCNIDASFSQLSNRVGIGVCIRDDTGTFVLAKTEWFTPVCEVHVGEALGLLSALEWVHHLQLGPIDFELDAKKVVDSFSSAHQDVTEFGMIIHNCKTIFEQYYVNSSVEFVRRQANEAAHRLAKAATSSASFQILVEIPDCIEHILSNEMI